MNHGSGQNKGAHRMRWGASREVEEERIDELLELIWTLREKGVSDMDHLLETAQDIEARSILRQMIKDDLFQTEGNRIILKERGEEKAREIIRRHRLTERLLYEIFEMSEEEVEEEACKLEHILSPGVTESVCTFLGHPPTCIHGKPIPRGECCAKFRKEMKPLVIPLDELGLGEEGRIVFIAPKSHQRLDRLSTLGIVPGSILRMHQKNPSYVLQIGETTLALDRDIIKNIYVKKV
ncbi:MAG TPA: iron dependent repressor, metal binding and dimerization domain protein [Thermodesulfobacteriota bacterium]|nr:iron dependent repressor, metal binding and dimerization domain protein [Thermodesulfobacteriota bacterium]